MNISQVNFFIFYAAATVGDLFRQCHELLVLMFMNNLLVADAEAFPKLLEFIIEIHVQTNLVLHLDACLNHLAFQIRLKPNLLQFFLKFFNPTFKNDKQRK